ncbi:hypothetical protein CGCSCA4_v007953 [Colletotrichum siamense]|uniref:Uncharacterized protein n=1 Tax=Colletotrichum siamense TaxID=690259 RepID=A0A9P5K7A0_COLSI|nr:hypothetical protein CGCSCA5_v002695 [Colletotrichum siamense]KAF4843610.1 hypothetical protein CGCSCA4_v007953 [Colletotrichum siamense]KAF4863250.1 hypothetical protein CGCSCA2_v002831 [Colletotrichum siamense]
MAQTPHLGTSSTISSLRGLTVENMQKKTILPDDERQLKRTTLHYGCRSNAA